MHLVVLIRRHEQVLVALRPAKLDVPAFGLIRNAPAPVTGLAIACRMLENTGPTTKLAWSRSTNSRAFVTATSGFCSSSTVVTVRLHPAELAAKIVQRQHEAVTPLLSQHRRRAGQREHQPDAQRRRLCR